jgi:hypothetical protein
MTQRQTARRTQTKASVVRPNTIEERFRRIIEQSADDVVRRANEIVRDRSKRQRALDTQAS